MKKAEELSQPNSCLNRAAAGELIFVLLERDIAAPGTVRTWCELRCISGKNKWTDEQIMEALRWADRVEAKQKLMVKP